MKGRLVRMMKKWWIPVLVITLALSLTSCAKKRDRLLGNNYGFGYCDGALGSFDVYLIPVQGNNVSYELTIVPFDVLAGSIVRIAIMNEQMIFRQLISEVVINPNVEIQAGIITQADLEFYSVLAIRPSEPGTDFLGGTAVEDAVCNLPLPPGGILGNTF